MKFLFIFTLIFVGLSTPKSHASSAVSDIQYALQIINQIDVASLSQDQKAKLELAKAKMGFAYENMVSNLRACTVYSQNGHFHVYAGGSGIVSTVHTDDDAVLKMDHYRSQGLCK